MYVFLPGFVGLTEKSPVFWTGLAGADLATGAAFFSSLIDWGLAAPGASRASWFICLAPALLASLEVPSSTAAVGAAAARALGLADSSLSLNPMLPPVLADVRSRGAALTAGSTARALFFAGAGAGAALEALAFGAGFAAAGFGAGAALALGAAFALGLAAVGFFAAGFGAAFFTAFFGACVRAYYGDVTQMIQRCELRPSWARPCAWAPLSAWARPCASRAPCASARPS